MAITTGPSKGDCEASQSTSSEAGSTHTNDDAVTASRLRPRRPHPATSLLRRRSVDVVDEFSDSIRRTGGTAGVSSTQAPGIARDRDGEILRTT
ncbi:MAG: hypothetical protein HGA44_19125 [Cellulomonadaceae bacterium]|nr:hypothetical protein [Cellulomonadaceae bacterium]